jgi:hypothetical protein
MSMSRDLPASEGTPPSRDHDWPAQAADTIVDVVGKTRQKTTGPALTAVRGVVYGVRILILTTMAMLLLVIGLVRLANNWIDVWLTYVALGTIFVIIGAIMWRQRDRAVDDIDGVGNEAPR